MANEKEEKASAGGAIIRILTGRWFLSGVGAIALGLLVWFIGPLIPALDSGLALTLCLAIIFFAWLTANLVLDVRAARHNADMIAQVAAGAPAEGRVRSESDRAAAEQVSVLRQKLEQALTVLRKSQSKNSKKRQYLYELPWYIMIGPPGSGKTTALNNSGLKFPLANKFGKEPLKGVGGTRDCEWMFSEDAILLDTAGRYTTQDSNRQVDERAWQGFLRLLKQFRPRQPVNGIMIALGVSDLLAMTPAVRGAWAKEINERLAELHKEFGLKLPVYVLLTKADLIAGFIEFFDDLDREDRGQVWGTTFTLEDAAREDGAIATFDAEFDALTARLNERLLERVQDERDSERRARIFGFPMQFASLKPVLQDFLGEIFTPTRFAASPLLRGVYFTSATQQGTPFDRLLETMGKTLGLKLPAASGPGRAYFITRLLKDVIFEEASLVGANPKVERRNRLIRGGALSAIAAVGALLIAAWTVSYLANSTLIANEQAAAAEYRTIVEALPKTPINDDNVLGVLPALDKLRALPAGYDTAQASTPLMRDFGLNQGRKLESQAVDVYRHALDRLLLPHLLVGIETQLRNNLNNPDALEVFLPIYLTLGGQGPADKTASQANIENTKAALATFWGPRAYPRLAPEESRVQFEKHVSAMFEDLVEPAVLDINLLGRARQIFANTPIPQRAYAAIRTSAAARTLPEWRVVDHAGAAASQVFVRKTPGKLLSDGVPGFYTYRGFHEVLEPQVADAIKKAVDETSWVLGPQQAVQPDNRTIAGYEQQTVDRYATDFITIWDQFLNDITVVPPPDRNQLANTLIILSGPGSPLNLFARAVAEETTMNRPPTGAAADAAAAAASAAAKAAGPAGGIAAQLLGKASYNSAAIDDHFKALHDRVAGPPGQTPLDNLLKQLGDLANAPDAAPRLQQLAPTLPQPLQSAVGGAAGASSKLNVTEKRAAIQSAYVQTVLPVCRLLEGRYPLARNVNPAPIDDFRSFFMPNGILDTFFNSNNLANYLDRTPAGWKNKADRDLNLNLSGGLGLFQTAQRVRDSFFSGGPAMTVVFDVTPTGLGDDIQKVDLEIDGQMLSYERGSTPPPKTMQWPGPNSAGGARVAFTKMDGPPATIGFPGPWGLLQLLDGGLKGGNAPDQFPVVFSTPDGLNVRFQIAVRSARNPLRNHNFEPLRCPAQL